MKVILLGNRISAYVIKLNYLNFGPNPMTGVFFVREIWKEIQTQREDNHVKIQAEIEVTFPQAKEHHGFWETPETRRAKKGFFPRAYLERTWAC